MLWAGKNVTEEISLAADLPPVLLAWEELAHNEI